MEFWRYYRIIRRRRWLILIGMAICVGVVAFYNYTTVQLYTGRTTVMEPSGMSMDQIPLYPEQFAQLDMNLRLSNLGSIASSQRVMQNASLTLADLGMKFTPGEILSHTNVSPVRDTSQLAIEVTLPEQNEAKIAADVIAAEFKKVYGDLSNSAVRQSREFIEAQLETTRKAMVKAQNELSRFKQESGVVQLDSQTGAIIQRLAGAKGEIAQAQASEMAAQAAVERLEAEMAKLPDTYITSKSIARDPGWQDLTTSLMKLEVERARMTTGGPGVSQRGPNHPDVVALDRQIDGVKKQLQDVKEEYVSGSQESKNPNLSAAVDQFIRAKVETVSQQARRQAMEATADSVLSELTELPADEAKLAELSAEVDSAGRTYMLMRNKLDEAVIKEQQAKNEVALKTIDPAYVFPVDQRRVLKLMLALLLSPLLGVGVALLLHYADNTIKTAGEAEKLLGVPVYSAVPGARAHSLVRQKCPEIMSVAYQMMTSHLWMPFKTWALTLLFGSAGPTSAEV